LKTAKVIVPSFVGGCKQGTDETSCTDKNISSRTVKEETALTIKVRITYIVKRRSTLQWAQRVRGLSAQVGLLGGDPEIVLVVGSHFNIGDWMS
jgi:hypothetical protein